MEVVQPRCAGLDVSKRDVKVCVRIQGRGSRPTRATVTTWGSTTRQILALRDMLVEEGVGMVVIESTGTYWKPFYYLLEDHLALTLVNAREAKTVPGRKTDVADAEWLADLGAHGLVRASLVPPPPIRELRDLTRTRATICAGPCPGGATVGEASRGRPNQIVQCGHRPLRGCQPPDPHRIDVWGDRTCCPGAAPRCVEVERCRPDRSLNRPFHRAPCLHDPASAQQNRPAQRGNPTPRAADRAEDQFRAGPAGPAHQYPWGEPDGRRHHHRRDRRRHDRLSHCRTSMLLGRGQSRAT